MAVGGSFREAGSAPVDWVEGISVGVANSFVGLARVGVWVGSSRLGPRGALHCWKALGMNSAPAPTTVNAEAARIMRVFREEEGIACGDYIRGIIFDCRIYE